MRRLKALATLALVLALGIATASAQPPRSQCMDPSWFQAWISSTLGAAQRIVLAIDNSWDRPDRPFEIERLPIEKQCALVIVQTLRGKEFAILSFNLSVTVVQGLTTDTSALINAINSIQGTTNPLQNMAAAIDTACQFTQPVSPRGALVLLTTLSPMTPPDLSSAARRAAERFKADCSPTLAVLDAGIESCPLRGLASPGAYFNASPIIVDTFTTVTFLNARGDQWEFGAPPSNGILVRALAPWVIQEGHWIKDNQPFGDPIPELGGQTVRSIEIGFLNRFGTVRLDDREIKLIPPKTSESNFLGLEILAQQEWVIQAAFWTENDITCDQITELTEQSGQSIRVVTPVSNN